MQHFFPRALSIIALGWGMVACGGSDDGFQFPGASGTSLPYEVMGKVDNAEKTELRNGSYGSSLAPHPTLEGYFYGLSDRGPNAATEPTRTPSGIIFITPEYTPRIGLFKLTPEGKAELVSTILLKDPKGRPITGLPNRQFGGTGETPYSLDGSVVSLDPDGDGVKGFDESGLDSEGLVAMKDGTFWISDEYGPHIVHFDATGKEIERINPFAADPRNKAGRTLPAELSTRWPNRGMEGLTITPDGKTLVGMMQSNLYNPTSAVGSINLVRMITVNIETGATAQYLYRQDAAGLANSEIVALSATSFLVVERDTKFYGIDTGVVRKNIYRIDLSQATNVDRSNAALRSANTSLTVHAANGLLVDGKTLELVVKDGGTADNYAAGWAQLAALGIRPVAKTLAYDAIASQKYPHDKLEGMWVIDANRLAILNDADFVIAPDNLGGIKQKYLYDGKADSNMLYVVKPIAPLY